MKVSVVLCTYAESMYDHFREAADSVLDQTYEDVELVIIVDGSSAVYERVTEEFDARRNVQISLNDENQGLLASRNRGVELATGDVVAFIDDDAVADEGWVETLLESYETHDALAVGGKLVPRWIAGKPDYLPEEYYWLVGVTHRGFATGATEVRNTFGSNISFRRDVFLELGGFDTDVGGRKGEKNLQAGETELCMRLGNRYGRGVWYTPAAVVEHKVFDYRTRIGWLCDRAFWQGYSKRSMDRIHPATGGTERAFLLYMVTDAGPHRLVALSKRPSRSKLTQVTFLMVFTLLVGFGYVYGLLVGA